MSPSPFLNIVTASRSWVFWLRRVFALVDSSEEWIYGAWLGYDRGLYVEPQTSEVLILIDGVVLVHVECLEDLNDNF